jgi:hypothetical protein
MKKFNLTMYISVIAFLIVTGCGKNQNPFAGNVYYHDADSLAFITGFEVDTLYYIVRGPTFNQSHKSKYTSTMLNDSTYRIELTVKPPFWEKNTWDIVLPQDKNDKGFYSADSRNYYQISDKSILR